MDHINPQNRYHHSSRAVIRLNDLIFFPKWISGTLHRFHTLSHLNALQHDKRALVDFFSWKKQRQTPPHVRFPRSIVRLLPGSPSLDIVADDTVRVRRSEQFVEVVLDVVVHADRQVPLCGEREDVSFFRLS
jgi:hypothetical protein